MSFLDHLGFEFPEDDPKKKPFLDASNFVPDPGGLYPPKPEPKKTDPGSVNIPGPISFSGALEDKLAFLKANGVNMTLEELKALEAEKVKAASLKGSTMGKVGPAGNQPIGKVKAVNADGTVDVELFGSPIPWKDDVGRFVCKKNADPEIEAISTKHVEGLLRYGYENGLVF